MNHFMGDSTLIQELNPNLHHSNFPNNSSNLIHQADALLILNWKKLNNETL